MQKKLDKDQILDWFYQHDAEWQNDVFSEIDKEPFSDEFMEELKNRYNL